MSKITVIQLAEWGKGRDFGSEPLRLDQCSVITDQNLFFKSHIQTLEAGRDSKNKRLLMPSYERLVKFYNLVNENDKKAKNT